MKIRIFISILLPLISYPMVSQGQSADDDAATESSATDNTDTVSQNPAAVDETDSSEANTDQLVESDVSFGGEGSLGWITSRGNTNNESLNAEITIKLEGSRWLHSFTAKTKKVREEDTVTAERYLFTEKSDFAVGDRTYMYGSLRYDDDHFDGFEYQASAALGIGWHVVSRSDHHLDLELGAGYRQSELTDTGEKNSESIARLYQHYDIGFSESSQFFENLLIESGKSNMATEFTTGLKVAINSKLALKLSYDIKHNSDPAPGNKSTDRTTTVNLVFGF